MWAFDPKTKEWSLVESKDTPDVMMILDSQEGVIPWSNIKTKFLCLEGFKM